MRSVTDSPVGLEGAVLSVHGAVMTHKLLRRERLPVPSTASTWYWYTDAQCRPVSVVTGLGTEAISTPFE